MLEAAKEGARENTTLVKLEFGRYTRSFDQIIKTINILKNLK